MIFISVGSVGLRCAMTLWNEHTGTCSFQASALRSRQASVSLLVPLPVMNTSSTVLFFKTCHAQVFLSVHSPFPMPHDKDRLEARKRHRIPSRRFTEAANNAKQAAQVKQTKVQQAKIRAKKRGAASHSRAIVEHVDDNDEVRMLKGVCPPYFIVLYA